MTTNKELDLKLVFFKTALQAIITREGVLAVKSKEQVAKEAMEYAENATKLWQIKVYEKSVL